MTIRLRRIGTKKKPYYRIVVSDSRKTPRGSFLDIIGHYDPSTDPPKIVVDNEKANGWMKKGASASETVRSLLEKAAQTQ